MNYWRFGRKVVSNQWVIFSVVVRAKANVFVPVLNNTGNEHMAQDGFSGKWTTNGEMCAAGLGGSAWDRHLWYAREAGKHGQRENWNHDNGPRESLNWPMGSSKVGITLQDCSALGWGGPDPGDLYMSHQSLDMGCPGEGTWHTHQLLQN